MDISSAKSETPADWKLLKRHDSSQAYISRSWDYEDGQRLVIGIGKKVVEASIFRHSLRGMHIKTVVEMPTSFGCQVQCPHCASGGIEMVRLLSASDLGTIYSLVAKDVVGPRLISFAGIGECSLNARAIFSFARDVVLDAPSTFTLTTVGIRPDFIDQVDSLSIDIPIKMLQISFFGSRPRQVREFMGPAFARYEIDRLIERIKAASRVHIRINIVLMQGLNTEESDWEGIFKCFDGLQSIISIRVSLLNETSVSRNNGIKPSSRALVVACARWFGLKGFDAYPFMSSFNDNMNCGQLLWKYEREKKATHVRHDYLEV